MSGLGVVFAIAVDSWDFCDDFLRRSLVWIYDCVCLIFILVGAYLLRMGVCFLLVLGLSEVSFTCKNVCREVCVRFVGDC